jgi:hypothetical protein
MDEGKSTRSCLAFVSGTRITFVDMTDFAIYQRKLSQRVLIDAHTFCVPQPYVHNGKECILIQEQNGNTRQILIPVTDIDPLSFELDADMYKSERELELNLSPYFKALKFVVREASGLVSRHVASSDHQSCKILQILNVETGDITTQVFGRRITALVYCSGSSPGLFVLCADGALYCLSASNQFSVVRSCSPCPKPTINIARYANCDTEICILFRNSSLLHVYNTLTDKWWEIKPRERDDHVNSIIYYDQRLFYTATSFARDQERDQDSQNYLTFLVECAGYDLRFEHTSLICSTRPLFSVEVSVSEQHLAGFEPRSPCSPFSLMSSHIGGHIDGQIGGAPSENPSGKSTLIKLLEPFVFNPQPPDSLVEVFPDGCCSFEEVD